MQKKTFYFLLFFIIIYFKVFICAEGKMSIYAQRTCEICGEKFLPNYASQVACSLSCKKKRRKNQKYRYDKNRRLAIKSLKLSYFVAQGKIEKLQAKFDEFGKNNYELSQKLTDANLRIESLQSDLENAENEISRLDNIIHNIEKNDVKQSHPDSKETSINNPYGLKECKRMKLMAMRLPCGEREECWLNPPCEKTKGMNKDDVLINRFNRDFNI